MATRTPARASMPFALLALAAMQLPSAALAALSVAKLSDSVVDQNALVLASSGEWGRGINGQAFQADALVTYNGYQYTAWYRNDADMSVVIARRPVTGPDAGAWNVVDTGSNLTRGDDAWDVHNVISLGISRGDGRIHFSWDTHVHSLRYRASAAGVATHNPGAWGPGMFGAERNHLATPGDVPPMTYPMFINTPAGGMHFAFRNNHSGNGDFLLANYAGGSWSTPKIVIGKTGGTYADFSGNSTTRNGYPDGFSYGPDGKLHLTWTWRESFQGANHDINYAYSEDGGVTWKNNAGAIVADTGAGNALTLNDPGLVIKPLDRKQSLYNQQTMTVDTAGRVHTLVVHRRQEPGFEWQNGDDAWAPLDSAYHHYFRDPETGEWSERRLPVDLHVGTRPQIGYDADGNLFAVYTTREAGDTYKYSAGDLVIAGATAASGYTDWAVLHVENLDSGVGFISEPLIDRERLLRDGVLSIFAQEDAPSVPGRTGTKLHVLEFAVPEPASSMTVGLLGSAALARRRW